MSRLLRFVIPMLVCLALVPATATGAAASPGDPWHDSPPWDQCMIAQNPPVAKICADIWFSSTDVWVNTWVWDQRADRQCAWGALEVVYTDGSPVDLTTWRVCRIDGQATFKSFYIDFMPNHHVKTVRIAAKRDNGSFWWAFLYPW